MRWTKSFIATQRQSPANLEAKSHKLLLRASYIKQVVSGIYSLLPLAQKVRLKIIAILREEMANIGGQEFFLPALQPLELWQDSGRLAAVSEIMFKLCDRKGADFALGLTHEELFAAIAAGGISSYKQLPQICYQIQSKFRDEARPRGGLLRTREFTMKDSYSFDMDYQGLEKSFELHRQAYRKIFGRLGLEFIEVQADSGSMGGSQSIEFMMICECGEDKIVRCDSCNYAANIEKAESKPDQIPVESEADEPLEEFATFGIRTIAELENFDCRAKAARQIKTLVFLADGNLVLALVQGDQELNEFKLKAYLGASRLTQASTDEIFEALGAHPGSLGACKIESGPDERIKAIIADTRLAGRKNMCTGANKNGFHLSGVSVSRDIKVDGFTDLHTVKENDLCIHCKAKISIVRGLELGHIFQLGSFYSKAAGLELISPDAKKTPLLMGSYGIGIERLIAAIAEQFSDDKGLVWPLACAPYELIIMNVNNKDDLQKNAAASIYEKFKKAGIDCLFDDRDERAGVKFNDAELIGIPYRITVSNKIQNGLIEFMERANGMKSEMTVEQALESIQKARLALDLT